MPECRQAHARDHELWKIRRSRGQNTTGRTPSSNAHGHILALIAAAPDMHLTAVAKASGLSSTLLYAIINGQKRTIGLATERRILAVTRWHLHPVSDAGRIDNTITRRQVTALIAAGYSKRWIAAQLGFGDSWCHKVLNNASVTVATARKVEQLAGRVGLTPGPSSRARTHGRKMGYQPPAWYDQHWQPPEVADDSQLEPAPTHEQELLERWRALVAEGMRVGLTTREIAERAAVGGLPRATPQAVLKERQRLHRAARRAELAASPRLDGALNDAA